MLQSEHHKISLSIYPWMSFLNFLLHFSAILGDEKSEDCIEWEKTMLQLSAQGGTEELSSESASDILLPEGAPATLDITNDGGVAGKLDLVKSVTYKFSGIDSSVQHAEVGSTLRITLPWPHEFNINFVEDVESHQNDAYNRYIDVSGEDADIYNADTIVTYFHEMISGQQPDLFAQTTYNGNGELIIDMLPIHRPKVTIEELGGDTGAKLAVYGVTSNAVDIASGAQNETDLETDQSVNVEHNHVFANITLQAGFIAAGTKYQIHYDGQDYEYTAQQGDTINDVATELVALWDNHLYGIVPIVMPSRNPFLEDAHIFINVDPHKAGHNYRIALDDGSTLEEYFTEPDLTVATFEGDHAFHLQMDSVMAVTLLHKMRMIFWIILTKMHVCILI